MQRIMHIALRGATHGTMRRMHHAVHAPMAQAYPLLVLLCLSILPLLLAIANAAVKAVTGKALFLGRIDTYDPRGPSSSATPKRNAREIFDVGLTNLKAEPTAWLFGAPSALYSNEPPPAVPPPAGAVALCNALCNGDAMHFGANTRT